MIDIRGDIKKAHTGVMSEVDFLGSERVVTYALLTFCFCGNVLLMWSLWQFLVIFITIVGFIIGRLMFKSDPFLVSIFIDSLIFENKRNKYILSSSNEDKAKNKFVKDSVVL